MLRAIGSILYFQYNYFRYFNTCVIKDLNFYPHLCRQKGGTKEVHTTQNYLSHFDVICYNVSDNRYAVTCIEK